MNDYKQIRQRYLAGESQRHIAKTMGISRNTVAKYCEGNTVPWKRKTPIRECSVITDEVTAFIKQCLEEDQEVSFKKQTHTRTLTVLVRIHSMAFTEGKNPR